MACGRPVHGKRRQRQTPPREIPAGAVPTERRAADAP
eukprot:CAMPEP_0171255466 /NCGR_PEP_ID=MMETSP0790-20130122/52784_1 /TAXON_ID=2925 /ORGANISM="Alexandrium catenella, Strain OF101" /LENGTH=36 /DNA_ID= /DNA_START= /DNA_END= /DNA_ORIENTATION=